MIAFIKGGMTIPMGRVTQDYLINHRLTPHQCASNLFRILGSVDALNEQMGLGLTWLDVVHMYECQKLTSTGYYLKSRSDIVRLISSARNLPARDIISSLGLTSLDWYPAFLSLTKAWRMTTWLSRRSGMTVFIAQLGRESQVGYLRISPFGRGFSPFSFIPFHF